MRVLRRHWLIAVLLTAGLALRLLAQFGYRPALFYIDTIRYLYNSGGNDPVGYRLPLRAILAVGDLAAVAAVQHVLGLAMAVAIYLTLLRRGTPRWLAALAAAPVLLDAYQIQIEQMILPDVWFQALIVAGVAVLLLSQRQAARNLHPALRIVVIAGLIFGVCATFRQVGEILVLPALLYLIVAGGGWRAVLARSAAFTAAFAVPVLGYMTGSYFLTGHFYLSHSGVTTAYGRMAWAADCRGLRLPAVQRALCPTPDQRALGPDGLEHSPLSPIKPYYTGPLSHQASQLVASFNAAVLRQQPGRVAVSYLRDVVKPFALTRTGSPGDPPISRWQFQADYPFLRPHATPSVVLPAIAQYGGGRPRVWHAAAGFLRGYQLGGGYTPGPLLAFCVLAGLAGSVLAGLRRRVSVERGRLALACLLFFGCGAAVVALSDLFEFSWRYQLPALVTLPPAAAAAVAALTVTRATGQSDDTRRLAQAGEEVGLRD